MTTLLRVKFRDQDTLYLWYPKKDDTFLSVGKGRVLRIKGIAVCLIRSDFT